MGSVEMILEANDGVSIEDCGACHSTTEPSAGAAGSIRTRGVSGSGRASSEITGAAECAVGMRGGKLWDRLALADWFFV
jgi:hypothetical protein